MNGLVVDSFAGGGGASLGISWALGRGPDVAINHDVSAIIMHRENHRDTRHYTEDVWKVSPREVTGGWPVDLLWASPDCKHFSRAKGAKPVNKKIRSLAWVVTKWAAQSRPAVIILENVREFEGWGPVVPRWKCAGCGWAGTEGQAKMLRRRAACPRCDSVRIREVVGEDGAPLLVPCPKRRGTTFRRFVGRLKGMGYVVDWRVMDAADFGAPTHRRRLFLIARRDGAPICWPERTYGDPKKMTLTKHLKPWRTAAECIDWDIPCPSIFDRKKPLAEATMRRIAMGVKRYVLDNPRPFIVGVGGRMGQSPAASVDSPGNTVTAKNDRAVVVPVMVPMSHDNPPTSPADPMQTVTTQKNKNTIITPILIPVTHAGERCGIPADAPLPTITAAHRGEQAVIVPSLIQMGYGERLGQAPRVLDLGAPMGTVVGGGRKQALVAAFLAKHYGGVVGHGVERPLGTVTAKDHHSLVAANLVHMNHGGKQSSSPEDPMRTVMSGGTHAALVYSFLVKYFGTAVGQLVDEPLHTVTQKDRFGLIVVLIAGEPYVVVDIGMRMLTPRELARGQGFPDSYVLTGTQTSQVARIGNSVCPQMAEALVRANLGPVALRAAA